MELPGRTPIEAKKDSSKAKEVWGVQELIQFDW